MCCSRVPIMQLDGQALSLFWRVSDRRRKQHFLNCAGQVGPEIEHRAAEHVVYGCHSSFPYAAGI
jgi:hypothetical protein